MVMAKKSRERVFMSHSPVWVCSGAEREKSNFAFWPSQKRAQIHGSRPSTISRRRLPLPTECGLIWINVESLPAFPRHADGAGTRARAWFAVGGDRVDQHQRLAM